ncbi:5-formyltetrahydrofolate cyclo-ligase [Gloeocapsopsis dulcis]|uniref:5-formyltetrahydrofolate cyclo-ligase n=1 Tax=Gloeocapsopsis dulcis TaxID=2859516 RepID=UPI00191412B0|nr:5-formyltetrahydrofolate cyclo-ligase [Gloeocapsopsis dulcis]WNN92050.1 5-formyltetrahydrofolate cyclo-ligase [Gloeocapsopsis dulcis]
MSQPTNKIELRRLLLHKRQSMSLKEWQEKSYLISFHLQASLLFTQAKTILTYFSFRQEPELSALFTAKKSWGFPRCIDQSLNWHLWQPGNDTQLGSYGILEPHPCAPLIKANEVDLILVPTVACDVRGYRLGYGGGFYDRLLSSVEWNSKPTIGIVFDFAYLPQLPIENWDIPLNGVCTETGLKTTH